ncbi:hypothetical protein GCM10020221_24320 [Streptomyces thioluteus]|uniref:Ammonium transporter n=1 Tax=Streptomyces thioluteus TaxID=66431 RepID=A0ABN3WTJ4_STRTU
MSGALADRVKFSAWCLFITLWVTVVYFSGRPLGLAARRLALQAQGDRLRRRHGVHINAGVGALSRPPRRRQAHRLPQDPMRPHSLPLVMLGAGLLWFGWFGFKRRLRARRQRHRREHGPQHPGRHGAAMLGWLAYERVRHGAFTTLGAASGAVAGLVAITPPAPR